MCKWTKERKKWSGTFLQSKNLYQNSPFEIIGIKTGEAPWLLLQWQLLNTYEGIITHSSDNRVSRRVVLLSMVTNQGLNSFSRARWKFLWSYDPKQFDDLRFIYTNRDKNNWSSQGHMIFVIQLSVLVYYFKQASLLIITR